MLFDVEHEFILVVASEGDCGAVPHLEHGLFNLQHMVHVDHI